MKRIILLIGVTFSVLLLSGCIGNDRETGLLIKEGKVIEIEYDIIFGGTFTDWRDELFFDDGTCLWIQDSDLSTIELNRTGRFYFEKNYFEYEGCWYRFHKLTKVEYYDIN